jgi:hypothetical protein
METPVVPVSRNAPFAFVIAFNFLKEIINWVLCL